MSYQALLFCPDEKTARTVTQVLSELDFNVTPCTEPFAAVKKFMSERFDAVVVDCDNEQNATLLFKSARSAPNNQGALAVAVVEGQAGVAKAFRIGANLVLTKPINVEQAKGTLRVARGLLRKNEGAKPTGASAPAVPKASSPTVSAKPTAQPAAPNRSERGTPPVVAIPAPVIPIEKSAPAPSVMASSPIEIEAVRKPDAFGGFAGKPAEKDSEPGAAESLSATPAPASHAQISSRQAAAAAPAREAKRIAPIEQKPSEKAFEPATHAKTDSHAHAGSVEKTTVAPHAFTFGGTVAAAEKRSGGKNTILIAVVAVIVIAAGGYGAWMKWGAMLTQTKAAAKPAMAPSSPAPVGPAVPATNSATTVTAPDAGVPPAKPSEGESTDVRELETEKPLKATKPEAHPAKSNVAPDSAKPTASVIAESKVPAPQPAPQPIVVKGEHAKAAQQQPVESADAPALSAVAPSDAAMPDLGSANNGPTPVLQKLTISQGVSRGLLIKQVQPVYPRTAIEMHIEGAVELLATVTKNGNISEAKILSGDKQLAHAAVDAVKQWKYKPYLLNGEPVDIQTQITVNFKLPN